MDIPARTAMGLNRISAKRKASTVLRYNSTIAVKPRPKAQKMSIEELKASGLLTKASKVGKSSRSKWKAKADKWFSEFIRLRDSDEHGRVKCVTCSHTDHWRYLQCGHCLERGNMSTRYDEKNCNAQCAGCNWNGGQRVKHEAAIDAKHGEGTVAALELKEKVWRATKSQIKERDFRFYADTYRSRVERIKQAEPGRYFGKGG